MRDRPNVSRRKILAGLAGVGSIGAFAGGTTSAVFNDIEVFGNTFGAGALDVSLTWAGPGAGPQQGNAVALSIDDLDPCESGYATLSVALPEAEPNNNPGVVWLRPLCPEPTTVLENHLKVSLYYADCDTGAAIEPIIEDRSLLEFANTVHGGYRLEPPNGSGPAGNCFAVGEEVCLRFEYTLNGAYDATESMGMAFEVVAQQCRHNDGMTNPFGPTPENPCGESDCICCESVGKYDLQESSLTVGTEYAFTEVANGYEGYSLLVLDTVDKDGGDETVAAEFAVLDPDGDRVDLCEVTVVGGPPHSPARSRTYEVSGDTASGLLASQPKADAMDSDPEEDPEAFYGISHVTVSTCLSRLADCWDGCDDEEDTDD